MSHPYADIPELSQSADAVGVIRIPTEQDVPFTRRVRAIVDTPQFQRLRHITQLALSSRVYPGATHTRFEHALGVFHNALKYLWCLGRQERFSAIVSPHDAEVLIVAALLHDIGHWPFCHPIEDMALPGMPPHEVFAGEFINSSTELGEVLRRDWNIEPSEVLDVLVKRTDSASGRLRRSILSGPIDIDKMDYLARDSAHCGVPYGRNFDRNRLISSLCVNETGDGLAITTKGRTAAEMMVFARYVMFSEVYWHHAVRASTAMFAGAFHALLPKLNVTTLFHMTESELIRTLVTTAAGTSVENLTAGVFGTSRVLHKRVAEYSVSSNEPLYRMLRQLSYPRIAEASARLTQLVSARMKRSLEPYSILIDAPPLHREVEFKVDVFSKTDGSYRPLRNVSPVVDAMARTQFDDCVKKVRVFANADLRDVVSSLDELDEMVANAAQ